MFATIREEFSAISSSTLDLRRFGWVMAVAFGLLAAWLWYKDRPAHIYVAGAAGAFGLLALLLPRLLLPFQLVWMGLAVVMGFFMSRIMLGIIFFGMFTTIGGFMRLRGRDLLNFKLSRGQGGSYWQARSPWNGKPDAYEKQF